MYCSILDGLFFNCSTFQLLISLIAQFIDYSNFTITQFIDWSTLKRLNSRLLNFSILIVNFTTRSTQFIDYSISWLFNFAITQFIDWSTHRMLCSQSFDFLIAQFSIIQFLDHSVSQLLNSSMLIFATVQVSELLLLFKKKVR